MLIVNSNQPAFGFLLLIEIQNEITHCEGFCHFFGLFFFFFSLFTKALICLWTRVKLD